MLSATFIIDSNGKKLSAVIPIRQYQHLLEELKELDDIRAYDEAKARKEKPIPSAMPSEKDAKGISISFGQNSRFFNKNPAPGL